MKRSLLLVGAVVVAFVVLSAGVVLGASMFSDVPDDHPFSSDIEWLFAADVTKGCNAGTEFCPEDEVTRGQMAAFMRRFAKFLGAEDGTVNSADSAGTAGSVGGWTAAGLGMLEQRVSDLECRVVTETLSFPLGIWIDLDLDLVSEPIVQPWTLFPPPEGADFWVAAEEDLPWVLAPNSTAYARLRDTPLESLDPCAVDPSNEVYQNGINPPSGTAGHAVDETLIVRTTENDYYLMKLALSGVGANITIEIDYVRLPGATWIAQVAALEQRIEDSDAWIADAEQRIADLEACWAAPETLAVGDTNIYVDLDAGALAGTIFGGVPLAGEDFFFQIAAPATLSGVNGTGYKVLTDTPLNLLSPCQVTPGDYAFGPGAVEVDAVDTVIVRTTEDDYYLMRVSGPPGSIVIDYVKIP